MFCNLVKYKKWVVKKVKAGLHSSLSQSAHAMEVPSSELVPRQSSSMMISEDGVICCKMKFISFIYHKINYLKIHKVFVIILPRPQM